MSRFDRCVALTTALLAVGCAVAPEENAPRATATNVAPTEPSPTASSATDTARTETARAQEAAPKIVDVQGLAPGDTGVICRETLKPGSNVIVTRCMSPASWERFQRFQRRDAQEVLRRLQGSAYR
jgi:hypothetical protein